MLNKVSYKMAKKLAECTEINKVDIYVYGLELIISTTIGLISILILSGILSNFMSGLIFILAFVPLRLFTGGYHAMTYRGCFIISNLSYLLVLFIRNIAWENSPIIIWIFLIIMVSCYIGRKAPIIHCSQSISLDKQKHNKNLTKIILLGDMVWITYLAFYNKEMMVMAILGICLVSAFMLITDKSIFTHFV